MQIWFREKNKREISDTQFSSGLATRRCHVFQTQFFKHNGGLISNICTLLTLVQFKDTLLTSIERKNFLDSARAIVFFYCLRHDFLRKFAPRTFKNHRKLSGAFFLPIYVNFIQQNRKPFISERPSFSDCSSIKIYSTNFLKKFPSRRLKKGERRKRSTDSSCRLDGVRGRLYEAWISYPPDSE